MSEIMEQFWKEKYDDLDKEYYKFLSLSSQLTGYFAGLAKYSPAIDDQQRIGMYESLIRMWESKNPDSPLTKEWVEGWKKDIQEIVEKSK